MNVCVKSRQSLRLQLDWLCGLSHCTRLANRDPTFSTSPEGLRNRVNFSFLVQIIDLLAIAILNGFAAKFQGRSQGAVGGREFIRHQQDSFQRFVASQAPVHLGNDAFVESLDFRVAHQLLPRRKGHVIRSGPLLEQGKVWGDNYRSKFPAVSQHHGSSDQGIQLDGILDRLWCNELSTRSFEKVLLAISDGQKSVLIKIADIPGFEPTIHKCFSGLLGPVPVTSKNRWTAYQNL